MQTNGNTGRKTYKNKQTNRSGYSYKYTGKLTDKQTNIFGYSYKYTGRQTDIDKHTRSRHADKLINLDRNIKIQVGKCIHHDKQTNRQINR